MAAFTTIQGLRVENQKDLLCGKHSINNLLQMEKLVADRHDRRLLIPAPGAADPSDPRDPNVQINMAEYCKRFSRVEKKRYGEVAACDHVSGDYDVGLLTAVLENLLRLRVELPCGTNVQGTIDTDETLLRTCLQTNLKKPNLLGFILNYKRGYHWTTVMVNSPACPPSIPRKRKQAFTLIDSHPPTVSCFTRLETLVRALVLEQTTTVIAVFNERPSALQRFVDMGMDEELAHQAIIEHGFEDVALNALTDGRVRMPVPVRATLRRLRFGTGAIEAALERHSNNPSRTGKIAKAMVAALPPTFTLAEAKVQLMGLGFSEEHVDRAMAVHGRDVPAAFAFLRRGNAFRSRAVVRAPCAPGQVRNRTTKACRDKKRAGKAARSPCPAGQVRNRTSKACRDKKKAGRPSKKAKGDGAGAGAN